MGINLSAVRKARVEVRQIRASRLIKEDVFNHIAFAGKKIGFYDKTADDVEGIFEDMRMNGTLRGNMMFVLFGAFGVYCEHQLTSVWELLHELP